MAQRPLTPPEIAQLRAWNKSADAFGQLGEALGPQLQASLNPGSSDVQRVIAGVPYEEVPVAEPMPWLPVADNIAWGLNDRVVTFSGGTPGSEQIGRLGFDDPSYIFQIYASVRSTNLALPATVDDSLNLFRLQLENSQGRKWQTSPVMGGSVCGTAQRPRNFGRPSLRFDRGSTLLVKVTPLIADLEIDIVLVALQTTGPGNV